MDAKELEKRFTYHEPKEGQPARYAIVRNDARLLASTLVANCPESRELSLALTKLEECAFWANAAIAREEAMDERE